jgi:hypothetical protein
MMYSPSILAWPISRECAVDLVESTNLDKDCRVCMINNRIFVIVDRLLSLSLALKLQPLSH